MNPLKPEIAMATGAAIRVGALCMAVIVFATMWESDARPQHSHHWLAQRAEQRAQRAEQRAQLVERGGIGQSRVGAQQSDTRQVSVRDVLPEGIVPGQYLVADTGGRVRRIRVTRSMTTSTSPERDQYTLWDGSTTIYFIRVRSGNGIARNTQARQERS